jgi:hypothetical protein
VIVSLKDVPAFQAKMTFAMARLAMVELCRVFHLSSIPHSEDRIGHDEIQALDAQLSASGLAWLDSCPAHHKVAEFDATYEPFLQALANVSQDPSLPRDPLEYELKLTRMAVPNLTFFKLAGILRADHADAAKPPEVVLHRLHGSRPRTVWAGRGCRRSQGQVTPSVSEVKPSSSSHQRSLSYG